MPPMAQAWHTHLYSMPECMSCVQLPQRFPVGHPIALYNLGGHYFAGKGVEQSFEQAAEYYERAAAVGFTPAQVRTTELSLH